MINKFFRLGLAFVLILVLFGDALAPIAQAATPDCAPTWSEVPTPKLKPGESALNVLAAVSTDDIWSFGEYSTDFRHVGVIEKWDGYQWTRVPAPKPEPRFSRLTGGVALASNDVWAVGNGADQVLTLHWDGTAWSIIPHPTFPAGSDLSSISANSANDIWGVGGQPFGTYHMASIYHWDGAVWSTVATFPRGQDSALPAVKAIAPDNVWAIGAYTPDGPGPDLPLSQTFITHFDGTAWHIVDSPNIANANNGMIAIAGTAANDVWAIGGYDGDESPGSFLAHWDSTSWKIDASTLALLKKRELRAISVVNANDIWAVGKAFTAKSPVIALHWNGIEWREMPIHTQHTPSFLLDVTALSSTDVWAVGVYEIEGHTYPDDLAPLIMRYGAAIPAPLQSTPAQNAVLEKTRVNLVWHASTCAGSYEIVVKLNSAQGMTVEAQTNLTASHYETTRLAASNMFGMCAAVMPMVAGFGQNGNRLQFLREKSKMQSDNPLPLENV